MKKLKPIMLLSLFALCGCSGNVPDLGVNNGKLNACPDSPNCVSSQAADEAHYIEPISFRGTQKEARKQLLEILKNEDRIKILVNRDDYIRAEFTSAFFRFVDDVEFYFPEQQMVNTIIDVRSASRIGHSDLGANKKRIEGIRSKF